MAVRLLVMFSVMVFELGLGIAAILGVASNYPYQWNESGIAACVMIVAGILVSWMLTIAFFVRKSSRAKAVRLVDDAKIQAAKRRACGFRTAIYFHCGGLDLYPA